jgi:serine/threonine-protein kinase
VYGTLVAAGRDSVRAQATLFDVAAGRVISELEARDGVDRVDRLADSLAVRLMRELSRRRSLGVWHLASLGSSSPAALKAFLQGEQHYRRFALDSARFYYEQAIELDSTFALAHARRAVALGWSVHNDPEFLPSFLRAGALNHGLARRESLLLTADSIEGALPLLGGSAAGFALLDRYFSTLEYAAREYPFDPQVWYELGEARYHYGPYVGVTLPEMREAFASAVGLDSSFAPAYLHLFELTLLDEDVVQARQVLGGYLSRADSSAYRDGKAVLARILASGPSDSAAGAWLEALGEEGLFQAWYDVKWWVDSAETAVRLIRTWVESHDSVSGLGTLALSLAYRGHVREAVALVGRRQLLLDGQLARLGLLPHDSAAVMFGDWMREDNGIGIHFALPWWAEQGDTTTLLSALARWDSLAQTAEPARATLAGYLTSVAAAYLSLARHDTMAAISRLGELRNLPNCVICYQEQLTRARLLVALGQDAEAARVYDRLPFAQDQAPLIDAVAVALERGLVHERLGNREQAITALTFVVDAWRNADPELQPVVDDARAALARLAAEPRSKTGGP